jgi:hypothetical protein
MSEYEIVARVWGIPLHFVCTSMAPFEHVEAEFAGAVEVLTAEVSSKVAPLHSFIFIEGVVQVTPSFPQRIRHRGGSTGDKRFIDGTVFPAEIQNRDAVVVFESCEGGVYILDECTVASSPKLTTITGPVSSRFVLPDLVEAFALNHARSQSWVQCHGAGWLNDAGTASLAIGPSGAGKTTRLLASVNRTRRFLGNDRLFLRWHDARLEVRGYPLAMNVGCGTIRALKLDIPHFDGRDTDKVRLTPRNVTEFLTTDYDAWFAVGEISAPSTDDLLENLYIQPDPTHPSWNICWRNAIDPGVGETICAAALSAPLFRSSALKAVIG